MAVDDSRTRQLAHDRLSDRFDELMDDYDLGRRTAVLVEQFLGGVDLRGRLVLDAGCGVGGLTRALVARGARVVALDIGPQLATTTRRRYGCGAVVGSLASLSFTANTFDAVLSSEAIEHTPDPVASVLDLAGIPGEIGEGLPEAGTVDLTEGRTGVLLGSDDIWTVRWNEHDPCDPRAVIGNGFTRAEFLSALGDAGLAPSRSPS